MGVDGDMSTQSNIPAPVAAQPVVVVHGPTGPSGGPTGPTGPVGEATITGATGPRGPTGPFVFGTGPTGSPGAGAFTGPTGVTGPPGSGGTPGATGSTGPAGAFGHGWNARARNPEGIWVVDNVGQETSMGFQYEFVAQSSGQFLLMVSGTCGNTLAANRQVKITGRWNDKAVQAPPGPYETRPSFMGEVWGTPQTLINSSATQRMSFTIMGTIPDPFNGSFDPDTYPPISFGHTCWLDLSIQDPQSTTSGCYVADIQIMVLEL
jgi:hypothetical protein